MAENPFEGLEPKSEEWLQGYEAGHNSGQEHLRRAMKELLPRLIKNGNTVLVIENFINEVSVRMKAASSQVLAEYRELMAKGPRTN